MSSPMDDEVPEGLREAEDAMTAQAPFVAAMIAARDALWRQLREEGFLVEGSSSVLVICTRLGRDGEPITDPAEGNAATMFRGWDQDGDRLTTAGAASDLLGHLRELAAKVGVRIVPVDGGTEPPAPEMN